MNAATERWRETSGLAAALVAAAALVQGGGLLSAVGSAAILATLLLAWQPVRARPLRAAAAAATVLWALQRFLPPVVQWGNGLVIIALLLGGVLLTRLDAMPRPDAGRFFRLALLSTVLAYGASVFSFVRLLVAPTLDAAWPVAAEQIMLALFGGLLFLLIRQALAGPRPLLRGLSVGATLAALLYIILALDGGAGAPVILAASLLPWSLLVLLSTAAAVSPQGSTAPPAIRAPAPWWRARLNDLMVLMKVRVSSLLLLTTLGAMVIAARGWPGWALTGWVLLGGLLSVGGAGALNHYLDRDIDAKMGRTSRRPLPSGRVRPVTVLALGLGLSAAQFAIFWWQVNPAAAWLSLGGLLYYVVIYTIWLKRSSTQNIVIGGAAGAFPPLVGWAAVTGGLSLEAFYLFAIIFVWTPPHFWALALMRKADYARAEVPMLPVIRGDQETRLQILLYTLVMIGVTLALVPLGSMGLLYLVAALLLNARFLLDVVRLYRRPGNQPALRLYRYSLVYLALLFVAMALDRVLLT